MRILITNDDGRNAAGLVPLIECCRNYGEVFVCVPKFEQSGKSHGIELRKAFECKKETLDNGITLWAVDSTPSDCVRFAVLGLKERFDLVISGINKGYNMGADMLYSGTVSGAAEAVNLGIKAISVSTCPEYYNKAVDDLPAVLDYFKANSLLDLHGFYNVNIPPENKGFIFTHQGGAYFSDDFEHIGNDMYMPRGKCVYEPSVDITVDCDAVMNGYISISPLTVNKTDFDIFKKLK